VHFKPRGCGKRVGSSGSLITILELIKGASEPTKSMNLSRMGARIELSPYSGIFWLQTTVAQDFTSAIDPNPMIPGVQGEGVVVNTG
jgi:hypothetical protein